MQHLHLVFQYRIYVSPLPQAKSSFKSKGRKQEKFEILTSTPYKEELEDKLINKEAKSKREKLKRIIGGETYTSKKKNKEKQKQKTAAPVEAEDRETLTTLSIWSLWRNSRGMGSVQYV